MTETWAETELEPYVFNAKLDAEYPATLSKATITGILREKLGFDGVVVFDDMQMEAITQHYGIETAILAGVDILVFWQ